VISKNDFDFDFKSFFADDLILISNHYISDLTQR